MGAPLSFFFFLPRSGCSIRDLHCRYYLFWCGNDELVKSGPWNHHGKSSICLHTNSSGWRCQDLEMNRVTGFKNRLLLKGHAKCCAGLKRVPVFPPCILRLSVVHIHGCMYSHTQSLTGSSMGSETLRLIIRTRAWRHSAQEQRGTSRRRDENSWHQTQTHLFVLKAPCGVLSESLHWVLLTKQRESNKRHECIYPL